MTFRRPLRQILALAMFVVARRSVRYLSRKIVVDRDGIRWKDVDVPTRFPSSPRLCIVH